MSLISNSSTFDAAACLVVEMRTQLESLRDAGESPRRVERLERIVTSSMRDFRALKNSIETFNEKAERQRFVSILRKALRFYRMTKSN